MRLLDWRIKKSKFKSHINVYSRIEKYETLIEFFLSGGIRRFITFLSDRFSGILVTANNVRVTSTNQLIGSGSDDGAADASQPIS